MQGGGSTVYDCDWVSWHVFGTWLRNKKVLGVQQRHVFFQNLPTGQTFCDMLVTCHCHFWLRFLLNDNALEEDGYANYVMNECNHIDDDVQFYTGGIDLNYDSSWIGCGSGISEQWRNSKFIGNENKSNDL